MSESHGGKFSRFPLLEDRVTYSDDQKASMIAKCHSGQPEEDADGVIHRNGNSNLRKPPELTSLVNDAQ